MFHKDGSFFITGREICQDEDFKVEEDMLPTIEELRKIKKETDYKRIPIYETVYSDSMTPVEVMRRLRAVSKHCYLLESASLTESWGRYSFLGYDPLMEITCMDGKMVIRKRLVDGLKEEIVDNVAHPGENLRQILKEYKSPKVEGLPNFTGGLVGYFSYDYIKYAEPKLKLSADADFKDMDLMLFQDVIAFDHHQQKVYLITGVMVDDLETSYETAKRKIQQMKELLSSTTTYPFQEIQLESELTPKFEEKKYYTLVEKAKHYIHEGDIFQVVLSNPWKAKASGNLFDTYRVLRATNPSPYMFYFSSDDIEMAGASPETLAKLEDGVISSFPLAGTRPRGKTKEEDDALREELLADEKERSEHNMLVDLGRNDVGKIASVGSVNVTDYMNVLKFSQVMHIGSTVTGKIREDVDAIDCIDAILPAGTLSGAPKFRACQIIEELEQSQRGIYGGAVGYIDFTGNMDVCIAIRLVYKKNGEITIRSGAGIVADSVAEKEFTECRNKAKAVMLAIKEAEGGLH